MNDQLTLRFEQPGEPPLELKSAWLIDFDNAQLAATFDKLDDHTASLDLSGVAPGRYWLSCNIANHPVLRFTVRIEGVKGGEDDTERTISFAGRAPRCATIVASRAQAGTTQSRRVHAINIALPAKHSAVILVAGFDYQAEKGKPADYTVIARQWRDDLYYGQTDVGATPNQKLERAVHDHTVVSIFDFARGMMKQYMRGTKGWHDMYEAMCGNAPPHTANPKTDMEIRKSTDSISITDVYAFINDVGYYARGSIQELHFYSHAFPQAPVLLNTDDDSKGPERDPHDKDPRPKDLLIANEKHWPHLVGAFAPQAIIKSWGCYHDDVLKERILAILNTKDKTEMVLHQDEMINREMVMSDIAYEVGRSYIMALVEAAGIRGYAAAPGTTAGYKPGTKYMHVDQSAFGSILRWYEKNFKGRRDLTGHFPYAKINLDQAEDEGDL